MIRAERAKLNGFLRRMRDEYKRCVASGEMRRARMIKEFLRDNLAR